MADGDIQASPAALAPPSGEAARLAWLRLIRSRRVGIATFFRLMQAHTDADAALAALPGIAAAAGVADYTACPRQTAERELEAGHRAGARLLCWGEAAYPAALADLADPPPVLWARGDTGLLACPMVALVGARNASSLGARTARRLAAGLGEAGFVVVSGLARGIDAEAHRAALATGTAAVQAGGVDVTYPAENAALAGEIAAHGVQLSERPIGLHPQARDFPRRNRLISGLGRAIVVVEAAVRSGSLITARNALDQGREVLAVPGHPFDARSAGCNLLIRDGATLIRSVEDIAEALGPVEDDRQTARHREPAPRAAETANPAPARSPARNDARGMPGNAGSRGSREPRALHAAILDRLGPSPLGEDQLIRDLALPAGEVAPALLTLELEGRIARQPGGLLARAG